MRPGQPPPTLDPDKGTYLWQVNEDGTVSVAPQNQEGFGRVVKHGDLNPGPGGADRGVNRAGGELKPQYGPDGTCTGWEMNNESSNSFPNTRNDGVASTPDNLRASKELMQQGGMDTSNFNLVDYNGNPVSGD